MQLGDSPSSITADILSVDNIFKRKNGALYTHWRTMMLKEHLHSFYNINNDRRDIYALYRSYLLSNCPNITKRDGKRSYLLEQIAENKRKESLDNDINSDSSEDISINLEEEEHEEEELEEEHEEVDNIEVSDENNNKIEHQSSIDNINKPNTSTKPKIKRKNVINKDPNAIAAERRAKAAIKRKKRAALLKQKRLKRAENTVKLPGGGRVSDAYAFTGMHHIWDEHHEAVTRITFAHYNNSLLAFASYDGDISICYALPKPIVHIRIQGHTQCVTDLSFSSSNELLMSSSVDNTICVWRVSDGEAIRTINYSTEFISCTFHPFNNNLLFTGTIKGNLIIYNLSTGQIAQQHDLSGSVNTLTWEPTGKQLFAGDSKGFIYIFDFDNETGKITRTLKTSGYGRFSRSRPIISIQYKAWSNSPQHRPEILVSCQDNSVKLFNVTSNQSIKFKKEFRNIPNSSYRVRSCFCPLISLRDGACIVTGGEDMKIRIFDVLRTEKPCVNELMGHSGPVLDVCWNHEETLMGSCDAEGTVILWKRVKIIVEEDQVY